MLNVIWGFIVILLLLPSTASWRGRCFHQGFYGQSDICVEQGKEWKNLYFVHVADTTWSLYLFSYLCPGCWDTYCLEWLRPRLPGCIHAHNVPIVMNQELDAIF